MMWMFVVSAVLIVLIQALRSRFTLPAARGSSAGGVDGGQITAMPKTETREANPQHNLPSSSTRAADTERTVSPLVEEHDSGSNKSETRVEEDVLSATYTVNASSGISPSGELSSLKLDGTLSGNVSPMDSGKESFPSEKETLSSEKETLHLVKDDSQIVFGPAPSPIPVDQSVVGSSNPTERVSPEFGGVACPRDGSDGQVSEYPCAPQRRHNKSGSTSSSSSSSSSSSKDRLKQGSYDFGEPCEELPGEPEVNHTLDHTENHMEPLQLSTVVKEIPCERATASAQENKAGSCEEESPINSPRRIGSFGRPHLELLDPHVLLKDDSKKQTKGSRDTSPATENRYDINAVTTLAVPVQEASGTSLPQSDSVNIEVDECKFMEPVVISVTEHSDENRSLDVSSSSSTIADNLKDDEPEPSNDKHAEQGTPLASSEGDSLGESAKEEVVKRRSQNRPQKPVRVSLVKEDIIPASTAPLNTEMDRPLLPLKGTPRESSSSSSSSSSDSEEASSKKKPTEDTNESASPQVAPPTLHENTQENLTSELKNKGETTQGHQAQQFQNEKDSSEKQKPGAQMTTGLRDKHSDSSSANSSLYFTDTSLMDQIDLPDPERMEIHVTNETAAPQLHISLISSASSRKEFSDSESSASSSVCGKKGSRKPPVFVTPPPPPEKPVRTCGSQSDLSDRSDMEHDMVRVPPKPARSVDRLSTCASPAFDRDKPKENFSASASSAQSSGETDQETKPPLVPPRREKPRVNGADPACPNTRPQSGDHSAHASCASSSDSKPSDDEKIVKSSRPELHAHQGKPQPGQSLGRAPDHSGASAFVPYENSQIYFSDSAFTAPHVPSGSGHSVKGKSPKIKTSSSSDESKKGKEYSPPPVPPRQRMSSKGTARSLNVSTSSTTSLDSRGSHDHPSSDHKKPTSTECIIRGKNETDTQFIDRPRAGTCPQIHVSPAVRDKTNSSFELELPVRNESSSADSSCHQMFHSDVKLPLKPIRSPSPRTPSRTPSPKVPTPQTPSPEVVPRSSKSHFQSISTPGKAMVEPAHHTDEDTSEADVTTSMNRSISVSSTTSATSHEDDRSKKDSKSKLRKYWPFRRKKGNKKDKKGKWKDADTERSVSSPHLASLPLHQSTPTLERYASEPETSVNSTSLKADMSDSSRFQDSDASTLSASTTKQSKQKKAKDKQKDKKAKLSTSTSSSEQNRDDKTKEKPGNKKESTKEEQTKASSAENQSTSSSKNVTPTPERKSTSGTKTEDSKDKPCDTDKEHDVTTSSSSSAKSVRHSKLKDKEDSEEKSFMDLPLAPPRVATPLREHTPSFYPISPHAPQVDVQHHRFDGEFQRLDEDLQADADVATAAVERRPPMVVVAMDLGTTHSGYAFSFSRDPSSVYVMSRWAGQEPGLLNHKTLSALLLTPDRRFHSFGLAARNHYHNLLPIEARHWLYFERFKMTLHHCKELSRDTMVSAINGTQLPALTVFAHVLEFFATHALQQLSDQSGTEFRRQDVRWVVTVPAIWREPAKQLMRQAAFSAGMFTRANPSQLLIVLEPEAASIYCRRLRMHQLVPEVGAARPLQSPRRSMEVISNTPAVSNLTVDGSKSCESLDSLSEPTLESKVKGTRYLVVDCGGGTVDITVHELTCTGQLVELHRATGGPHGSTGVDAEFEALLRSIFSSDFMDSYQRQYPVGWVNLMTDFESRKRAASPFKTTSFNVSLPFTFISEYRKHKGEVDSAVKRHGDPEVEWSLQGMLRLAPNAMTRLFAPTLVSIRQAIGDVLNHPNTRDLRYLFLVGGFAESPLLQHEVRREFGHLLTVLIPQDVSLAVLRGAVLFGLDPKVVSVRCARQTYGVGILNRFDPTKHPVQKRVHREGMDWCTDIFDRFVAINEPVALGTSVTRRYTPARSGQLLIVLNIYSSVHPTSSFITDPGVRKCGTLYLDLRSSTPTSEESEVKAAEGEKEEKEGAPREILARMAFGDTEISVIALDVSSGKEVKASVDFLSG